MSENALEMESAPNGTVCMSHMADADGIISAALIREVFGGYTVLVNYREMLDTLNTVTANPDLKRLVICDIGLNHYTHDRFVDLLAYLRRRDVAVTYIDHHEIDPGIAERLENMDVELVNDPTECASVLVHERFKASLSEHSAFLAACAAITDYMDEAPIGSRLVQRFDRLFLMANASILAYNISGYQRENGSLLDIVSHLSMSKYPHDMQDGFDLARIEMEKAAFVMSRLRGNIMTMGNLGYAEADGTGAAGAVNFVLGLSGKNVGIAYRGNIYGQCTVSIRGTKACKSHLGRLTERIAGMTGGSGGGHALACGAIIPTENIINFISQLNANLDV